MKTKNILLAALIVIISSVSVALFGQDMRGLPSFDRIIVSQGVCVIYKQSQRQKVEVVSSRANVLDDVVTNVRNGILEIGLKSDHNVRKSDVITIYVESPSLKEVYTLKGASFKSDKISGVDNFRVIQNKESVVDITELDVKKNIELLVFGESKLNLRKLTANTLNLALKRNSRNNIKEVDIRSGINVVSEGDSFASIGGETPKLKLKGASMKCLDTRNLACDSIDFLGI